MTNQESARILDYLQLGQDVLLEVVKNINEGCSNDLIDERDAQLYYVELKKEMTSVVSAEHELKKHLKAVEQTNSKMSSHLNERSSQSSLDVDQLLEEERQLLAQADDFCVEQNDNFNKLSHLTGSLGEQEDEREVDDELEAIEDNSDKIPTDPFSKKEIETPVRHKRCGHVYDKEALTNVLRSRSGPIPKCPVVGCDTKRITLEDVEEDVQMKIKINRLKKRRDN